MTRSRGASRLIPDGADIIPFAQGSSKDPGTLGWGLNVSPAVYVAAKGDGTEELAAFQAAIDALPSIGGRIYVQPGDYSWLDPTDLVVATGKMLSWYDRKADLPTGMPGSIITSGFRNQPGETSGGINPRPGDAFERRIIASHIPNPAQESQQDSIYYAEGNVPYYVSGNPSEFAAYRFNMTSAAFDNVSTPGNLDIKGIQGVVRGVGGNAKVRSYRGVSWGLTGHDGIVTGVMQSAQRGGIIPASMGGDGTAVFVNGVAGPYKSGDAAIIGQVGPGIQAVFRAEGAAGKERPQYMFVQAFGNQAILPELAVFYLHGGGNGAIVRIAASETDTTVLAEWRKDGKLSVPSYRSNISTLSIGDDAVIAVPLPAAHGMFEFWVENNMGAFAKIQFRAASSGAVGVAQAFVGSLVDVKAAGTDLTGTTGTDGRVSVSVYQDSIKIENRLGATRNVGFLFLAN